MPIPRRERKPMFAIMMIPSAGAGFFLSAWILMIFWGILADDVGIRTISYNGAMLATVGLWMTVTPLIATVARRQQMGRWMWGVGRVFWRVFR